MFDTSSYTDRATYETWILVWFLWRMWSSERFESLQWNHLKKFELKSMIALLISIGLPVQLTFDISWATMGYDEGFIVLPEALPLVPANITAARHLIMETPSQLWSPYNKELRQIMQYLLCFSFALLTGTLFLVQAFWSHLTTQWGKKRFTTSTEFKLYIIFSIANFIIYPSILRAVSDDPIRSESAPQLAFSCTLIIVLFLSFRNNQKLQSLYPVVQRGPRAVETLMRLEYFVEMNKYLSFGVATITISFMILSIDAIAGPNLVLKRSWADFLISSFNFGALILWIVMILVIFPPNFYLIGMRSRLSMSGDPQAPPLSTRISTTSQAPSTYNQNSQETSTLNMNSTSPPGGFTPESKLLEKMPENEILEEKVVLSVHAMLEQQEKHMQQFRVNMNKTPPQSRTQSPPPVPQSSQLQQYLKSKQSSFKQPSFSETSRQSRETVRMSIASVQSSDLSLHRSARSQKTLSSASYVYI